MSATDPADFIRANTLLHEPPLIPEVKLHLASEIVPIWQMTEEELEKSGLPPPFWLSPGRGAKPCRAIFSITPKSCAANGCWISAPAPASSPLRP